MILYPCMCAGLIVLCWDANQSIPKMCGHWARFGTLSQKRCIGLHRWYLCHTHQHEGPFSWSWPCGELCNKVHCWTSWCKSSWSSKPCLPKKWNTIWTFHSCFRSLLVALVVRRSWFHKFAVCISFWVELLARYWFLGWYNICWPTLFHRRIYMKSICTDTVLNVSLLTEFCIPSP